MQSFIFIVKKNDNQGTLLDNQIVFTSTDLSAENLGNEVKENSHKTLIRTVLDDFQEQFNAYQATEVENSSEFTYFSKHLSYKDTHFHFHSYEFNDAKGQSLYLFSGNEVQRQFTTDSIEDPNFIRTLTDTLPDMLWAKDIQGRYLFANKAICENLLMAKNTSEPIGKTDVFFALRERATEPNNPNWHTFGELCHNSDDVTLEHMKPMRFEEYGNIKGKMCYLDVHKAPLYDSKGNLIGTVGSGRNITTQKELELQLEQNRQQLEDAQRIAHMGNYEWSITADTINFSAEAYRILGYEPNTKTLQLSDFLNHIHPEDRNKAEALIQQSINKQQQISDEYRIINAQGRVRYLMTTAKPTYNENGELVSFFGTIMDITKQTETQNEINRQKSVLEYQAQYDTLTDLPNRTLFTDRLHQAINNNRNSNHKVATLFIDLDHFKAINDSLGHSTGDNVLKAVSERFKNCLSNNITIARQGGDEFSIIIDKLRNNDAVLNTVNQLSDSLKNPITINDNPLYISMSIGIALYPDDGTDTESLLKNADAAMYKAKEDGRNTYRFYTQEMTEKAFERVALEASLREAVKNNQFEVFYQPQINIQTNRIHGMEALIRWKHPILGTVPPANFLGLAEETGLIIELDRWTMQTAMQQFTDWKRQGFEPGILSVNLAVQQIYQKDFIDVLDRIIQKTELDSELLELEISENQIMKNPEGAIQVLQLIRDMGVALSIDDFGTGYSSLSYLKKMPINTLKIDQSFTFNLPDDEEDKAITKAIIALATSLNLNVIAEGVEDQEQKDYMFENHCDILQGYFYSQPLPKDKIENFMKNFTSKEKP